MGYTTDFEGEFRLSRPLTAPEAEYLRQFNATRRMGRNPVVANLLPDPAREAVGLKIGPESQYYVGGHDEYTNGGVGGIYDCNRPPPGQPGLWCGWVPNEDGTAIVWDGGEKFYYYVEWLRYIQQQFLSLWGVTMTGEVTYQGEDSSDFGKIVVRAGEISQVEGVRSYGKDPTAEELTSALDDYIDELDELAATTGTVTVSSVMDRLRSIVYGVEP